MFYGRKKFHREKPADVLSEEFVVSIHTPQTHYERIPLIQNAREVIRKSRRIFMKFLTRLRRGRWDAARGSQARRKVKTRTTGRAVRTVRLESVRKPGSRSIVILLSDCYPEPITRKYKDIMDEPAYYRAIRAASLYKKRGISLLLIKPSYASSSGRKEMFPGEKLAKEIVRVSGGRLMQIETHDNPMDGKRRITSFNNRGEWV